MITSQASFFYNIVNINLINTYENYLIEGIYTKI